MMHKVKRKHALKLSRAWKETVAPQGRRVLTNAGKLIYSFNKLVRFLLQLAVNQCHAYIIKTKGKIYASWRRIGRRCHNFIIETQEKLYISWRRFARRCHRTLVLTKRLMLNTWYRFVGKCYRIYVIICEAVVSAWERCCALVDTAVRAVCHTSHLATQACHRAFTLTKNLIVTSWQAAFRAAASVAVATAQACYKAFTYTKNVIVTSYQTTVRTLTGAARVTAQACYRGFIFTKNLIVTSWQAAYRAAAAAAAATAQACYKAFTYTKNVIVTSYQTTVRTLTGAARVTAQACYRGFIFTKTLIITSWQAAFRALTTAAVATAHACYKAFTYSREVIVTSWQAIVKALTTAATVAAQAIVRACAFARNAMIAAWQAALKVLTATKEAICTTLRQWYEALLSARAALYTALENFVVQCHKDDSAIRYQLFTTWNKVARSCQRLYAFGRNLIVSSWEKLCGAVVIVVKRVAGCSHRAFVKTRELIFTTAQNFGKQCAKVTAITIQTSTQFIRFLMRHLIRGCRALRAYTGRTIEFVKEKRAAYIAARNPVIEDVVEPIAPVETQEVEKEHLQIKQLVALMAEKLNRVSVPVKSHGWVLASSSILCISVVTYLILNKNTSSPLVGPLAGPSGEPELADIMPFAAETHPLLASAAPPPSTEVYHVPKKGGYTFWPKRMTLRHVEGWGEGVSFGTDYSTCALFISPDYHVGKVMPILDIRGHRFDNNRYAANVGLAGRYIPKSGDGFCQILGFNAFYDWREGHKGNYNQVGVGLEVLGKRWDFRANGYAPVGKTRRKTKCTFHYPGDYFIEHRECEFTSYGFNAEIGYYAMRSEDFFLYTAIGPYYMVRRCHDRTRGGMFRIRPQYKDYLAFEGSVSYDSVFKTVYQAQIIFYLPLYQLSKNGNKKPCNLTDYQIYQPIERYEVMPLGKRSCWMRNF